jgi:hypothetical protein
MPRLASKDGRSRRALVCVLALVVIGMFDAAPASAGGFLSYVDCLGPARVGCGQTLDG